MNYNLLYRWFLGLNAGDEVWDVTVFTKNWERLLQGEIAQRLLETMLKQARGKKLLRDTHVSPPGHRGTEKSYFLSIVSPW